MTQVEELRALAERYGVPGVDLGEVVILVEDLELIPREVCEAHVILPVLVRGEHVFLAMANPNDKRAIDEIEFVTGKKVYPYAAIAHELTRTIEAAHDARSRRAVYFLGANVSDGRMRELGVDSRGMQASDDYRVAHAARTPSGMIRVVAAPVVAPPTAPPSAHAERESYPIEDAGPDAEDLTLGGDSALRGSAGRNTNAESKLILVVDDEDEIREMLKRVLLSKGHRVVEAANGSIALQMVKQHVPDLLVLDAMLPGLHGFDVARRLKASPRYGAIPIIMISAIYRGWRVAEDLKSSYGILDYLEKPFRLADVVDAVTRALLPRPTAGETKDAAPPPDLDILSADAAKALDDGIAAYKAGDIDNAIALLKHGTDLDPLAYRLHFHLALLYGKKDQVFDGIGELEMAIELNPKHFPSLKNLALLYERAGFKNRAVEIWERCVHAAPDAVSRAQVKERLLHLL